MRSLVRFRDGQQYDAPLLWARRGIDRIVRYLDRRDLRCRIWSGGVDRGVRVVEGLRHTQLRRNELRIDWAAGSHRIEKLPRPLATGLRRESVERPDIRGSRARRG